MTRWLLQSTQLLSPSSSSSSPARRFKKSPSKPRMRNTCIRVSTKINIDEFSRNRENCRKIFLKKSTTVKSFLKYKFCKLLPWKYRKKYKNSEILWSFHFVFYVQGYYGKLSKKSQRNFRIFSPIFLLSAWSSRGHEWCAFLQKNLAYHKIKSFPPFLRPECPAWWSSGGGGWTRAGSRGRPPSAGSAAARPHDTPERSPCGRRNIYIICKFFITM